MTLFDITIQEEFVPLYEATPRADGTIPVKLIGVGWGSSGYYSEALLKQASPLYTAGTHNYWNHQTEREARERPERDLRDLASVLVEVAHYDPVGPLGPDGKPYGPGLYSRAKPFSHYAGAIKEMGPHIGMSHVALGKAEEGEAESRKGPIIKAISEVWSVDYVTRPGAKGAILEAFREACDGPACSRAQAQQSKIITESEENMVDITLEEVRKHPEIVEAIQKEAIDNAQNKDKLSEVLKENERLKAEVARANEANILRQARTFAEKSLDTVDLPVVTKERIASSLARNPVLKDGMLDEAEFKTKIDEAVKTESEYLAKVTESGTIKGLGGGGGKASASGSLEEAQKELVEAYVADGMDKEKAEKLVKGMI